MIAERDLVPQLGRADGVADQEDVRHTATLLIRRRSIGRVSLWGTALTDASRSDSPRSRTSAGPPGVLGWDQRVTMPPRRHRRARRASSRRSAGSRTSGSSTTRSAACSSGLRPLEESLEYDSDDASLVRVTRRDWEKAAPRADRAPRRDDSLRRRAAITSGSRRARTNDFAALPPVPPDGTSSSSGATSSASSGTTRPYTPLLDDYEPGHEDERGARGVRDDPARLSPSSSREAPEVDASFLRGAVRAGRAARVRRARARDARLRRRLLAARPDRAPVLHVVLEPRRPPHDALPRDRPRVALVDDARGRTRPLRARHRRRRSQRTPLAGRRRSGSTSRRAGPGRTSSGAAGRSGTHWYEPLQRRVPGAARRRRARRVPRARSTAPSPA